MNRATLIRCALSVAGSMLAFAAEAEPTIVYSSEHDGVSPTRQLINAFKNATAGETILIKPGVYAFGDEYTEIDGAGVTNLLKITVNDLTIAGDASTSRTNWMDRAEPVLIDGNGKGRIIYIGNGVSGIRISNVAFTGGNVTLPDDTAHQGGAIHNAAGSDGVGAVVISNCVFRQNKAAQFSAVSHATLIDCTVTNNAAIKRHAFTGTAYGCDFIENGNSATYKVFAYNCLFEGNTRSNGAAVDPEVNVMSNCVVRRNEGYLICAKGEYYDCDFYDNVATFDGAGAIDIPTKVKGCDFICNKGKDRNDTAATSTYQQGGAIGIYPKGSYLNRPVSIEGCSFVRNVAPSASSKSGGGAIRITSTGTSHVSISNCTFEGNSCATGIGGAILNQSADSDDGSKSHVEVRDSQFITNMALHACGVSGVKAEGCVFNRNSRSDSNVVYGFDAAKSHLVECEITGGGLTDCVVDRCFIHSVTNDQNLSIFNNYTRVTNSLVVDCGLNGAYSALYYASGTLDAEFVNCTFVKNRMRTLSCNQKPGITNFVKFVNCLFNDNYAYTHKSDIDATSRGGTALCWSRTSFENTYYGEFSDGNLKVADLTVKTNQTNALKLCSDPKFAGDHSVLMKKYPDEPFYALSYRSPLIGAGVRIDWEDGAVDLAGRERVRNGAVDVGCYQCWIAPPGTVISVR